MMSNHTENTTVCVVIPMYNSQNTIVRALNSICHQTELPDKVIVIDDGSTDDSASIVENFVAPFELVLIKQKNQGPSAARNLGIKESVEDIICFLDADDQWVETKLEKQLNLYRTLVNHGHKVGIIDCFEQILTNRGEDRLCNRVKQGQHFRDFALCNIINGTSCVMINRSVLVDKGGFDTDIRFAEDRWLWTQIAEHGEVHTVPEVLSYRHIADGNITSNPSKYLSHKIKFVDKFVKKYSSNFNTQEISQFVFSGFYDFQRCFYKERDYNNSMYVYRQMLDWSWRVLFYNRGKATMYFVMSFIMSLKSTLLTR